MTKYKVGNSKYNERRKGMKKQLVIIGIVAILVTVGLSGCNQVSNTLNPDKNKFVGTWTGQNSVYNFAFFSDGTGSFGLYSLTWDIKDGKLVMVTSDQSVTMSYSYAFSNNDRTLILTNPAETITLIKQ